MIRQSEYPVEPWQVREVGLNLDLLAQSESVFALANGHIGVRGNLDEGEPRGLPGTYLNSFCDVRPLPYAETGFGYPESGQSVVNVTNGKLVRLLVDDEPLDLRYGQVSHHERTLDLRAGTLRRVVEWTSPKGSTIRVRSTRLVSFTHRAILAIRYEVEAVSSPVRVVLQSELMANEEIEPESGDPRGATSIEHPLQAEEHTSRAHRSTLIHRSRSSGLIMAAAADHVLHGVPASILRTEVRKDWARTTIGARLLPGETIGVTKFVAYGWSGERSLPAIRDQVDAALSAALDSGWDSLLEAQRAYVEEFWDGADVEVVGDPAIQQAVRFGLWHVLQAGARAERRALPAKGLTGPGYDGHAFWDTETYVLPVLTATVPSAAADALRWRHSTTGLAMERAKTLGLRGAAFPWRTIQGQECSAYWPAGTAAFHVNADIAVAAARLVQWTADDLFDRTCALPILVETARLWASLGFHGNDGHFHIHGVTGPDEYSVIVDDNTYTNVMAARNLRDAADAVERWPDDAEQLQVSPAEVTDWRTAAATMAMPYDERLQVHEQDLGSTGREVWDFAASDAAQAYPLMLHAPYFDLYRKQVSKQADLVLAMHWCGDSFTREEKARAFAYYEPLTVRDSSLSACTQSVLAAEVGHLDLALDYLTEASMLDLHDLEHNTRDGVHLASLAGAWLALVCGFGGLRDHGGELTFAPRLPDPLVSLAFTIRWRGVRLRVAVTHTEATYTLQGDPGSELRLEHHGHLVTLAGGSSATLEIPEQTPLTPRPSQPAGRAPKVSRP
ncbi:MAG: glycosyl hydrolase family 65 protein [Nocardioides sp.]